jgi:hypothetical protein
VNTLEIDEDGEIFIDRDLTHFRLILNHLRGMEVSGNIIELNTNQKKELQQEIDFYQITSLFQHILRTVETDGLKPIYFRTA